MITANTDGSAPQAYLTYLVFDQNLQLIPGSSGMVQVPLGGTGPGGGLDWTTITPGLLDGDLVRIEVPGYIVVYINNNSIGKDVYFDNIKIEHYTGTVLDDNHYYPFGLTLSSTVTASTAPAQPRKYQSIELERSFGLEQYETPNRGLDPQLGRFTQVDPMAEASLYQSPYASMDNNPASNTDPDGLFSRFGAWWRNIAWGGDGIQKDNNGVWGVRTSGENWDGSFMTRLTVEGKPQAFPNQIKEHLRQQIEFEEAMHRTGVETKWVDNINEARKDLLNFSATLMINGAPQLNAAGAVSTAAEAATGFEKMAFKELQTLTKTYSKEMNAFFESKGAQVAPKEALNAYKELATRMLSNTGGAYQRVTEAANKLHTERIKLINKALERVK